MRKHLLFIVSIGFTVLCFSQGSYIDNYEQSLFEKQKVKKVEVKSTERKNEFYREHFYRNGMLAWKERDNVETNELFRDSLLYVEDDLFAVRTFKKVNREFVEVDRHSHIKSYNGKDLLIYETEKDSNGIVFQTENSYNRKGQKVNSTTKYPSSKYNVRYETVYEYAYSQLIFDSSVVYKPADAKDYQSHYTSYYKYNKLGNKTEIKKKGYHLSGMLFDRVTKYQYNMQSQLVGEEWFDIVNGEMTLTAICKYKYNKIGLLKKKILLSKYKQPKGVELLSAQPIRKTASKYKYTYYWQ